MNRKGELFINDMDAFGMWGVCLSDSSLCSLVEPEPLKDAVSNKSSTEDGKQIRKERSQRWTNGTLPYSSSFTQPAGTTCSRSSSHSRRN